MIKVASNLNTLCAKKSAETQGDDGQTDSPKKKRRVDYRGRAQRGAITGAIPGSLLGGLLGTAIANDEFSQKLYNPESVTDPKAALLATILGGTLPGAIGGGLLGGATGAGANMLGGFLNEDVITQADEPNRERRGLMGALLGGLGGGAYGTALGSYYSGPRGDLTPFIGGLAGAGLGAVAGGLGDAYLGPWLNKDVYSQDYMDKKSELGEEKSVPLTVAKTTIDVRDPRVSEAAGRNYVLNDALLGGGVGAGLGGGLALLLEALSDKEEKEYLVSLLKGTVGGGLTGAGAGALTGYLTGAGRKQIEISRAVENLLNSVGTSAYDASKRESYKQPLIKVSPFPQSVLGVFNSNGTAPILEERSERTYPDEMFENKD